MDLLVVKKDDTIVIFTGDGMNEDIIKSLTSEHLRYLVVRFGNAIPVAYYKMEVGKDVDISTRHYIENLTVLVAFMIEENDGMDKIIRRAGRELF